jgi:hypothetical protein
MECPSWRGGGKKNGGGGGGGHTLHGCHDRACEIDEPMGVAGDQE